MFKRFFPKSPDPNINKNADSTPVKFGHINALIDYINDVPPGSGIASVTGDIVDNSIPLNPVVNTPTLQQVSDSGPLTNNSTIRQGIIEHGYGGGISRLCANNKDDQWEDGVRYLIHETGGFKNVVYTENSNNVNPSSTDDKNLFYVVGTRWKNLVTGVEYICTQETVEDAIWQPQSGTWTPTFSAFSGAITDATLTSATYLRVGNIVTCAIYFEIEYDFSGPIISGEFEFTYPIATTTVNGGGSMSSSGIIKQFNGSVRTNRIVMLSEDTTLTGDGDTCHAIFQYEIN